MGPGVKVAEASRDPSAVTSVIHHTVGAGSESRYEVWFRKISAIAETFPGHRGVDFIRPPKGSRTYTIALHFDTSEHLGQWLSSEARIQIIAEIEAYLEGGVGLPGVSNLLISAMIVGLLTYVIMPRYTRMVATWLYR
jgi:antibiotic biosynthesis monooxygenase (ABM) superfamily enzyme